MIPQDKTITGEWQAVSSSAVQFYENLGLLKDENNKLIYVGQGGTDKMNEQANSLTAEVKGTMSGDSFSGFVKQLWQFPHKGISDMDFVIFTKESEAYRDEFIAEVIHMILSLDLPYVTLNKLRNVIREKVKIKLFSCDDLRRILEQYPKHVTLKEHAGSDSDDDDPEAKTNTIRVNVKFEVRLCERHKVLPFDKERCICSALHICPFYLLSKCTKVDCPLRHDLRTPHNVNVITENRLHRSTIAEIIDHLRHIDHRSIDTTVPAVCKFYNRRRGCSKDSENDNEEMCTDIHLCFFYAVDTCRKGTDCEFAHSIMKGQPLVLLQKYGLDQNEFGEFNILSLVRKTLRVRRHELEQLHNTLSDKTLTENEVKICVARGINPKLLQLKNVKRQLSGISHCDQTNVSVVCQSSVEQPTGGDGIKVVDESDKKINCTKDLQLKAQKALVEKALNDLEGLEANTKEEKNLGTEKSVIPLICKFYNNDTGCARSNEMCEFIHVCHHYITGNCKYGGRCKRSHDLTSGQPESIQSRLGLIYKPKSEIIEVLKKLCGKTLTSEENLPCLQTI